MKNAMLCVLVLCTMTTTGLGGDDKKTLPEVKYSFAMQWRLGAPAFAYEYFPSFEHRDPVIYVGYMAPRGMLVLSSPAHQDKAVKSIVLRSKSVDITSLVRVAGAHYRKFGSDKSEYVSLDKLPKIKVMYEPLLPKTIAIPGETNCVLLFQIGKGEKEDEWIAGHWSVSIEFDANKLSATFLPGGTGAVEVPAGEGKDDGIHLVYNFNFVAKTIETEADKHNWLHFQYLDLISQEKKEFRNKALEPLGTLIKAYPTDANLLYARAQLLADQEKYEEAIKDIESIKELLKRNTLRSQFKILPGQDRMSKAQIIAFLDAIAKMWAQKASVESATQPKESPEPAEAETGDSTGEEKTSDSDDVNSN